MRSPRHRPGTREPSPSALAPASPHPPELNRELIAPDAPADRGSSLVSTMIRAGSWPLHGSSYLQSIVNPARALLRGGSGGGVGGSGRRSSPRASRPPRQWIGHPASSGYSGAACSRYGRAREPGHSAGSPLGQPGDGFPAAGGNVTGHGPIITSASRTAATRRCQQPGSPRAGCVSLASAGGSDVWLSLSAAPANSHQTRAAPAKTGPGVGLGEPFREPSAADTERRRAARPDNSSS